MKYEYNGHLRYEARIELVSNEIINYYPFISKEEAKLIAAMETPIIDDVTNNIKFRRIYNILFIKRDIDTYNRIFNDALVMFKDDKNILYSLSKLKEYIEKNIFPRYEDII